MTLFPSRTLDFIWRRQQRSGFEYLCVPDTLCALGPHIQVAFPLWVFNLSKDCVGAIVLSRFRVIRTLWRVAVSAWTQVSRFSAETVSAVVSQLQWPSAEPVRTLQVSLDRHGWSSATCHLGHSEACQWLQGGSLCPARKGISSSMDGVLWAMSGMSFNWGWAVTGAINFFSLCNEGFCQGHCSATWPHGCSTSEHEVSWVPPDSAIHTRHTLLWAKDTLMWHSRWNILISCFVPKDIIFLAKKNGLGCIQNFWEIFIEQLCCTHTSEPTIYIYCENYFIKEVNLTS